MEMQIQARNTRLSEDTRANLIKKLERVESKLKSPVDAHVVVSEEKTRSQQDRFVVEVTLRCNGKLLRGQVRAPSVQVAVDALVTTPDRRVAHFKSTFYRSEAANRTNDAKSIREIETPEPVEEPEEGEELASIGRVVRSKEVRDETDVCGRSGDPDGDAGSLVLPVPELQHRDAQRTVPAERRRLWV